MSIVLSPNSIGIVLKTVPFLNLKTHQTVILLDIDGVLTPINNDISQVSDWDWQSYDVEGMEVYFAKDMLDALSDLNVEIKWLTTWEDLANGGPGRIGGWDDKEVLKKKTLNQINKWWKHDFVLDLSSKYQKIIWIDDDNQEYRVKDNVIKFTPNPFIGLSKEDLDHLFWII